MDAFPNGRERGGALWAIDNRRSIRKFQNTPLPRACVLEILQCALKAPSSKNRQPWKFVVVEGRAREEMLRAFEQGLNREEASPLLPDSNIHLPAAKHTLKILRQAPVVIFVVNPLGKPLGASLTAEERVYEICNTQSVAAAIENMLLAATEMGVGSLWVCDIYFAYAELCAWLRPEGELLAAVALGYPDEAPAPRPRRGIEDAVVWKS